MTENQEENNISEEKEEVVNEEEEEVVNEEENGVTVDESDWTVGSESVTEFVCNPCKQNTGHEKEAVGYCVDCSDYLCDICYEHHLRPRPCSNHKLLDRDAMPKGTKYHEDNTKCTEKCKRHTSQFVEFICENHDTLSCSTCLSIDHTDCGNVRYIPSIAEDYKHHVDGVYRMIDELVKTVGEVNKNVDENIVRETEILEENRDKLTSLRNKVKSFFDQLEQDAHKEVKKLVYLDSNSRKLAKKECEAISNDLQELKFDLESKADKEQYSQLYIALKNANQTLGDLKDRIEGVEKLNKPISCKFQQSTEISDIFTNVKTLACFSPETRELPSTDRRSAEIQATTIKCTSDGIIPIQRGPNDRKPNITSSHILPDGRLVLVNNENFSIHVIDVQTKQELNRATFTTRPWTVTIIESDRIAVTLPEEHAVAIFTMKARDLKFKERLSLDGECKAIEYCKGQFVVSFTKPECLKLISLNGNVVKTLLTDLECRSMVHGPHHIAISPCGSYIYVSNYDDSSVSCLSLDGKPLAVYKNEKLKQPTGIITDKGGNVYVCGAGSKNVMLLSPDCRTKGHVILNCRERPQSISYLDWENKLYISFLQREYVEVFAISFCHDTRKGSTQ